jgi:hypothetical protein
LATDYSASKQHQDGRWDGLSPRRLFAQRISDDGNLSLFEAFPRMRGRVGDNATHPSTHLPMAWRSSIVAAEEELNFLLENKLMLENKVIFPRKRIVL